MRLFFGTTCFSIQRFVQGEMSVTLQVDWRMQEMRVLLTTVLIFPKDHGHRAPTLTALRAAILVSNVPSMACG